MQHGSPLGREVTIQSLVRAKDKMNEKIEISGSRIQKAAGNPPEYLKNEDLNKMKSLFRGAALALAFLPLVCFGGSPKIAPDLAAADPRSTVDVVVQFVAPADANQQRRIGQMGGVRKADLDLIGAAVYSIPAVALDGLANDPNVRYVSPDRALNGLLDYANPTVGAQMALTYGWDGTNVGIAVIDSGINQTNDLLDKTARTSTSRIVYSQSFIPKVTSTADQFGHGTHVAGILAGNGTTSTGSNYFKTFRGMAPNAKLINLRVLDGNGAGTDSSVINAINAAIQLKNTYNIRIINLSLGRPVFESFLIDPLCQAVEKAWKAGIVVVVAAGNDGRNQSAGTDGYATITAPANDPLAITVGAMKTMNTPSRLDDLIASYSSKGPTLMDHVVKPDLVAPGNRTTSLLASKSLTSSSSNVNKIAYNSYQNTSSTAYSADYYRLSGTSMATPMVSGAVALMLTKDWTLTPDTVKARLMKTATKAFPLYSTANDPVTNASYTSQYDIFTIGTGYVDVWGALNSTDSVPAGASAASPVAVLDPVTNLVTVVNADVSIWGTHAVWGSTDLWATHAVWGSSVFVDGAAAVWGTSEVWGSHAVWGSGGTQGSAAVWGTHAVWGSTSTSTAESLGILINGEN
jgi:serine protease AprX